MTTSHGATLNLGCGMRAWARRDRFFLGGVGLASFVVLLCSAYCDDFWRTWVLPVRSHDVLWVVSWLLGVVLGIVLPLREEVMGLRDTALHRSVPFLSRTRSRLLWTLVILVASILLVGATQWGVEALFGDYVSVASLQNALPLGASASIVFLSLTTTWFAMQLDTGYVRRVILAAGLNFGLVALALVLLPGLRSHVSPAPLILFHVGVAAAFGTLIWFQTPGRHDPDLTTDSETGRWWSVLAAGGVVLVGTLGVYELRREALGQYGGSFLRIIEDPDGSVYFGVCTDQDPETVSAFAFGMPSVFRSSPSFVDWFGQRNLWIADGLLHVVKRGRDGSRLLTSSKHTLAKAGGTGRFAEGARVREWTRPNGEAGDTLREYWVVEPGADRLWRLDENAMELVAIPLPDGHTMVRSRRSFSVLLADEDGSRRVYRVDGGRLTALDPSVKRGDLFERVGITGDPLAPEVTVTTRQGETWTAPVPTTLDDGYERSDRRMALAAAYTMSAVQSPALAVWSYVTGPLPTRPYAQMDPLRDPLLANGHRGGLLFACLALAGLAGFGAWFYLRRIAAPHATRRWWVAFCCLTGPMGLVPVLILERPRAYRRLPSVAAPPPRLLTPRSA